MPPTTLVIGGGLIGLATACSLARDGRSICLIDPDIAPRGASWGNAGHIATEQVAPLASMATIRSFPHRLYWRGGALSLPIGSMPHWLPFSLRLMNAARPARFEQSKALLKGLLAEAMPAWERLTRDTDTAHLLRPSGHYIIWESEHSAAKGRDAWLGADCGTARMRAVRPDELRRLSSLTKPPIAGALFCEGSGQIADLGALADRLRTALLRLGGTIRQGRVNVLDIDQGKARARLNDGTPIDADTIIVAAGARSGDLLRPTGHSVPMIDERGYHIESPVDSDCWPEDMPPVVFEDRSMIVTRFLTGLRAASFVEFSRPGAAPDQSKWGRLHRHVRDIGLPIGEDARPWYGSRPTLPDYLPAIGRSDRAHNLFYAFGHQHLGLTLAAVTGEMMSMLLKDAPPPSALSLARFA